MDIDALKTELNTRLGDGDNFAFTSAEKTSILTRAMNDAYAVTSVKDTSLTFSNTAYTYSVPATLTTVQDIYVVDPNNSNDDLQLVASSLWEVVDGVINFKNRANNYIPDGYTLVLVGHYKVTSADTITDTSLQEYILTLALYNTLTQLNNKRLLRFLKNDTSVSEILNSKNELQREIADYRRRLPRRVESA